jgi:hypothetical protein
MICGTTISMCVSIIARSMATVIWGIANAIVDIMALTVRIPHVPVLHVITMN